MDAQPRRAESTPTGQGLEPWTGADLAGIRAARAAAAAWSVTAARLPWRSHLDRIRARQAAGLDPDDANFARLTEPALRARLP